MNFRRSIQRYGQTPEPETAYQRAGQVWDDRIGSARTQAKNWRLMSFGTLGLSAALASAVIWQGDAPPLFIKGENGESELVNYRVHDNYYIVDQLFAVAELRLGSDPQQVVRIRRKPDVRVSDANP